MTWREMHLERQEVIECETVERVAKKSWTRSESLSSPMYRTHVSTYQAAHHTALSSWIAPVGASWNAWRNVTNLVIGHIKCSLGKCKSLDPMIKVQCLLVSSTITLQAVLPFALLHPTSLDVFHEIIITCFFYKKSGQSHDGVDFPSLLCLIVVYVNTTGALFHFPHRLEQISRIIVIQEYVVNLIWCPRFVSIPFTTWSTEMNNTECPIHHLSFSFL